MIKDSFPYQNLETAQPDLAGLSQYEQTRILNKNSVFMSIFIILKLSLGLGAFVTPQIFASNGYVLGILTFLVVGVNVYVCSILLIKIADHVEHAKGLKPLENFEDVSLHLTSSQAANQAMYWLFKASARDTLIQRCS